MKRASITLVFLGLPLVGCARSPSVNLLGAFFPAWMFCIAGGIVLVGLFHRAARATGIAPKLGDSLFLIEIPLTVLLSLLLWMIFFRN
jgi:hypothetical protein